MQVDVVAVVVCKACDKRFSSIAGKCPHCGADPAAAGRERRGQHAGVGPNTHYMIAMLTAVGGAGWFYSALASGGDPTYAKWMVAAGLVWYVAARIWAAIRRR